MKVLQNKKKAKKIEKGKRDTKRYIIKLNHNIFEILS